MIDNISFIKGKIFSYDIIIADLEYKRDLLQHDLVEQEKKRGGG